jgi:hypothetical protein
VLRCRPHERNTGNRSLLFGRERFVIPVDACVKEALHDGSVAYGFASLFSYSLRTQSAAVSNQSLRGWTNLSFVSGLERQNGPRKHV